MDFVKTGASVPGGVKAAECFRKLNLGNFILTDMPARKDDALAAARFYRENKIYFAFSEFTFRGSKRFYRPAREKIPAGRFLSPADLEEIFREGGEYYLGRYVLGEAGGMLYWPKKYLIGRKAGNYRNLPPAKDIQEAKDSFISYLRGVLEFEGKFGGNPLIVVDSSISCKYFFEAGADSVFVEVMPGNCDIIFSAARGACRAFGKKGFGAHIAMACYGGVWLDAVWLKRWKMSLLSSFVAGADVVFPESGHFTYDQRNGQSFGFNSPEMKDVRRILRDFAFFSRIHKRPASRPRVKVGFVHGNLDGFPGLWNEYVWGQFHSREWLFQDAERGWKYLEGIYNKADWFYSYLKGEKDYSGEVPAGLYDLPPAEAPVEVLQKYSCLIFLGWNTMTESLYCKLKSYVEKGGHLLMAVPHLNSSVKRDGKIKLFRGGDFTDLFGVKAEGPGKKDMWGIKFIRKSSLRDYKFPVWRIATDPRFIGEKIPARVKLQGAKVIAGLSDAYHTDKKYSEERPFLTEYRLGKGAAFLINSWSWPGAAGMESAVKEILRVFLDGEKDRLRVQGSPRVRHACYERKGVRTIYVLNTDFDNDMPVSFELEGKGGSFSSAVGACGLKIFYFYSGIMVETGDNLINLDKAALEDGRVDFVFSSYKNQQIRVVNLSRRSKEAVINGSRKTLPPGRIVCCRIKRGPKESFENVGFSESLPEEPKMKWPGGKLPY